jgi:uncharacterized protein
MDIEWGTSALTAVVIFFATVIHGVAGFGTGQISMAVLPFFRDAGQASIIVSIIVLITNIRVFWSVRESWNFKEWIRPVIGLVLGLPLGIWLFGELDQESFSLAIGIVIILAAVLIAATREIESISKWIKDSGYRPGWPVALIAGFLSGFLGGAVSIPGPPMILFGAFMLENEFWGKKEMKAIFTSFFAVNLAYRLAVLTFTGDVTGPLALEALIIVPVLFLGTWLGIKLFDIMPEKYFRWGVLILLVVLGILLIVNPGSGG